MLQYNSCALYEKDFPKATYSLLSPDLHKTGIVTMMKPLLDAGVIVSLFIFLSWKCLTLYLQSKSKHLT